MAKSVSVNTDGGGDYLTLSAALQAEQTLVGGDLSVNGITTFTCSGLTPDTSLLSIGPGWTNNSALNKIVIIFLEEYNYQPTFDGVSVFQVWEAFTILDGLRMNAVQGTGGTSAIRMYSVATDCILQNMILNGPSDNRVSSYFGIRLDGTGCVLRNISSKNWETTGSDYDFLLQDDTKAINCTAVGRGLSTSSGGFFNGILTNCISAGHNFDYSWPSSPNLTNCASEDLSGSVGLTGILPSNANFADPANGDHRLVSGSAYIGAGVGPSVNADVPAVDFEGDVRSGATTDLGFDQFNDSSPPAFSTGPTALNIIAREIDVSATSNEPGFFSAVAVSPGAGAPSDAVFDSFDQACSNGELKTNTITGLMPVTTYDIECRLTDSIDQKTFATIQNVTTAQITPIVTSVNSGQPVRRGETFLIDGSDFGSSQGAGSVTLNGINCPIVSWVDSQIQASGPADGLLHTGLKSLVVTHDNSNFISVPDVSYQPATGYDFVVCGAPPYSINSVFSNVPGILENFEYYFQKIASIQGGPETASISIDSDGILTASGVVQNGSYQFDYLVIDASDSLISQNGQRTVTLNTDAQEQDSTPDQFDLGADVSDAPLGEQYTRQIILSGADNGVDMPVVSTNGAVSVNGSAFSSSPTVAQNQDTIDFRFNASVISSTATTHTLSVGGVFDSVETTTISVQDDVVDQFDMGSDIDNAELGQINTRSFIISGATPFLNLSVIPANCEISINDGSFSSSSLNAVNGDTVNFRTTAPLFNSESKICTISIGSISDSINVSTGIARQKGIVASYFESAGYISYNSVGQPIFVDLGFDATGAESIKISLIPEIGEEKTFNAEVQNSDITELDYSLKSGSYAKYIIKDGDIDYIGIWKLKATVKFSTNDIRNTNQVDVVVAK